MTPSYTYPVSVAFVKLLHVLKDLEIISEDDVKARKFLGTILYIRYFPRRVKLK